MDSIFQSYAMNVFEAVFFHVIFLLEICSTQSVSFYSLFLHTGTSDVIKLYCMSYFTWLVTAVNWPGGQLCLLDLMIIIEALVFVFLLFFFLDNTTDAKCFCHCVFFFFFMWWSALVPTSGLFPIFSPTWSVAEIHLWDSCCHLNTVSLLVTLSLRIMTSVEICSEEDLWMI